MVVGGVSFVANHWECRNLIGRKGNGGSSSVDVPQAAACLEGGVGGSDGWMQGGFPVIAALACSAAVWSLLFRQEGGWEARRRVGGWLQ